jgi:hypothetical protein
MTGPKTERSRDAGFSTTGTWKGSTAIGGYLGGNYQHHFANRAPPGGVVVDDTDAGTATVGTQGGRRRS